jgi:hypothetical protein
MNFGWIVATAESTIDYEIVASNLPSPGRHAVSSAVDANDLFGGHRVNEL